MIKDSLHAKSKASNTRWPIVLISFWMISILLLLMINYFNFATVYFTIQRDGGSLRVAESLLVGLCHRMPSRSFWIYDVPLGLCSRCTGIYLSALLALLVFPLKPSLLRMNLIKVSALLTPLLLDSILQHYGAYSGDNILRFITGTFFGFGLVVVSISLFHKLTNQKQL